MDARVDTLKPAKDLAAAGPIRMPNESAEYRKARTALLAEEIELRRHIERVAAQRRALPPGGEVTTDYKFVGPNGEATLKGLFGDKDTLVTYSYMFGPQRERPCPMCTNLLNAWDGNADDVAQRISLGVIARSPYERLAAWKAEQGWHALRLYQDVTGAFFKDYLGLTPDGSEVPAMNVFTRKDGVIRHFWAGEMTNDMADPGQDARGSVEHAPLWNILDLTPAGRDPKWYPKLDYSEA